MADRQANINVNYNINTQSVSAAEQAVKRAQTATDQFQKSVGQTGTTFQRTSQQFLSNGQKIASTIDGQRVQMQQLRAQIELTRASDTKRLQQLTADYKTLKTSVDSFNKSLQAQNTQTQSLTQSWGGLINGVRAFLAAGIVKEVVQTQLEMAKLEGKIQGVERAFSRLPESTMLLDNLRKATHGTVTDLELMQQALRANNFEIDLKKLGTLLEFAATRAQQTGQEVDYLVNSIVMGIGMKSILRLDNLGLSAVALRERLNGVSVKAASVAEITRVVSEVAEESQKKLGGYFETSATKVDQLKVAWEELKVSLAQTVGSSWLSEMLADASRSAGDLIKALALGGGNLQQTAYWMKQIEQQRGIEADAIERVNNIQKEENGTLEERGKFIQQEIDEYKRLIEVRRQEISALQQRARYLSDGDNLFKDAVKLQKENNISRADAIYLLKEEKKRIDEQIESQVRNNSVQEETLRLLRERLKAIDMEADSLGGQVQQLGQVEEYLDKIERLEEKIKLARQSSWSGTQKEIQGYQDEIQKTQKQLDLLLGTYNDFAKLKLGADTNIGGIQIKPLTAPISNFQVKTETIDELVDRLNKRFKENPPVIIPAADPGYDWGAFWEDGKTESFFQAGQAMQQNFLDATVWAEVDAYDQRIKNAERFYEEELELAGDNDRAKKLIEDQRQRVNDRLRREQAMKEKKARRTETIINIAAGVAKAFATSATIYEGIFYAGLVAAQGLTQLHAIDRAPLNFAKGVIDLKGKGTETSDSIPANLSRGESVMTAKETRKSMGILKAIRANKLDDKVLDRIKSGVSGGSQAAFVDNDGIISAINKQKYPDVIEQSGVVYRVYEKGKNYKLKVRAKSIR